jgi:hypothetical protein
MAFWYLLAFDVLKAVRPFSSLRKWSCVRVWRSREMASLVLQDMVAAMEYASVFYPRTPACLQRSCALCRMLRTRGVSAEVVIGVQSRPFYSHAWVEVNGAPVNERLRAREVYAVIDVWPKEEER